MRKIYIIEGLDCANCAREVAEHLQKDENIDKAVIDFVGKKLFITYKNEEYLIEQLSALISEVEDGVTLYGEGEKVAVIQKESKAKTFGEKNEIVIIRLVIASVALAFGYFWNLSNVLQIIIYISAYLCAGYDVLVAMVKKAYKKNFFNEYSLMGIATLGAFAIKEYHEAVLVMILYQIGELLQDASVENSRNTISSTLALKSKIANVWRNDNLITVDPKELNVNDIIDVKVGEMIPTDGYVMKGEGTLDTSNLTGESLPVDVKKDMEVMSGMILLSGHIEVCVSKKYEDSTASKILELIEENGDKKAKVERFVTKFASVYTPIVFGLSLLILFISLITKSTWHDSLYRALVFLVVSCPCAIVISVPLAYFVGIGALAHHGIIVKGANYIDSLREVKTIVCDKTGTLTKGQFKVTKIVTKSLKEEQFIEYLAYAESVSNHPIARSIVDYYQDKIDQNLISDVQEYSGLGIEIKYQNHVIRVGNDKFITRKKREKNKEVGTIVYMQIDGMNVGYVVLNDEIKDSATSFTKCIHEHEMKIYMLTGDKYAYAKKVSKKLQIDKTYAELLPDQKLMKLEELISESSNRNVLYLGDGINDAPSLVRADVGVAMGALGSDAAIESADIVVMNDDLNSVPFAMNASKKIYNTAIFNITLSLLFKLTCYLLTIIGHSSMWLALLADVGVALLAILNSVMLKKRINNGHE